MSSSIEFNIDSVILMYITIGILSLIVFLFVALFIVDRIRYKKFSKEVNDDTLRRRQEFEARRAEMNKKFETSSIARRERFNEAKEKHKTPWEDMLNRKENN